MRSGGDVVNNTAQIVLVAVAGGVTVVRLVRFLLQAHTDGRIAAHHTEQERQR
jgi:hypothetical protein